MVIYIRLQWRAGDPQMPLVLIGKAMAGILIGLFLITSALHWTDAHNTQKFTILMTELYNASGNKYYKEYSVTRLTSFRIASHAILFAAISRGLVKVLTKHGR